MNKTIPILILIGGTILIITMIKAKPEEIEEPEEENGLLPQYPVERVVFIQDQLTNLASQELNIPKTELNYMWT